MAKILRVTWLRITSAHPCLSPLMALTSLSAQVSTTVARVTTRYPASGMSRFISTTKPQGSGCNSARTLMARSNGTSLELQSPCLRTEPGWPSVNLAATSQDYSTQVASEYISTTPRQIGRSSGRPRMVRLQVTTPVSPSQFQMTENASRLDRARTATALVAFGFTHSLQTRRLHRLQVHRRVHRLRVRRRVLRRRARRRRVQVHRRRVHRHQAHRRRVHRHQAHRSLFHRRRRPVHHHPVPHLVRHLHQIQHHRRHRRRSHPAVRISM